MGGLEHAGDLFAPDMVKGDRDGETFNRERDRDRLDTAASRIFARMQDRKWYTIQKLAKVGRCSENTATARVRDLRKPQFGGWIVDRRHEGEGKWVYRWTGEKA